MPPAQVSWRRAIGVQHLSALSAIGTTDANNGTVIVDSDDRTTHEPSVTKTLCHRCYAYRQEEGGKRHLQEILCHCRVMAAASLLFRRASSSTIRRQA